MSESMSQLSASVVQCVARMAHQTFAVNRFVSEEIFNESLNKLNKLLSQMTHKDINLNKELMSESILSRLRSRRPSVTYVSILETKHFQMCVFGLRIPTVYNGCATIDSKSKDVCLLTPNQRNYHEVVAIDGPAAILDILGPPYEEDRECHYYKVVATVFDRRLQRDITWLLELEDVPQDYRCDSLPYIGPHIELN
ncbi:unnamed protein product [Medioppia subpectinata]|uniref:Uncharacterized protein n=1 Tax=Medioppia subpectinata TaxID=1979941 RepID=A0A7R9QG91_9ACAR|nr:unnamed protein product [Medioppia subpectinata]CAG2119484.1 unnamed protein product [Medioppia subpectinata]